jgi:hypothetical protein
MGYDIDKFSPSSGKALDSESNPINYIDILKLLNLKDGFHATSTELNALAEDKKGGVVGSESRVLIVPPNSSILYRITNLANTLSTATFEIDWIEVDV